ncbi:restriction endonuclease subunit S, partial [Oceanobacillus caeni]
FIHFLLAKYNWKGPFVYTNENAYDFLKKTSLFENDIIMSNVGTVGKFFKVPKMDKPMTLGPNALLFRSESNDMNFLYFYLNSKFFKKKLKRIITPGVQSKVNKTDLKKIAIKMPKLKEQEKIGDFFSKLDEHINKQSQKIDGLKLRKQGFLQKMFI